MEFDEQHQQEPTYENELDDDDQHYKETEAIPPAPKIQGRIPRTDQKNNSLAFDVGTNVNDAAGGGGTPADSVLMQNQKTISSGKLKTKTKM